jgi:GH25 family lysozyme M1 (1,4-beta-N-acetylmuramidase)
VDNLLVDLYAGDLRGKPDLLKLGAVGVPWVGVLLKATQGTWYPRGSYGDWFRRYWKMAEMAPLENEYRHPWMRGAYHYADINSKPEADAEAFMALVGSAGGIRPEDMCPVLDVEGAGNPKTPGPRRLQDWIGRFSNYIRKALGRGPILYGNIYLAENNYLGLCGCEGIIVARYTSTLPSSIYQRLGLSLKDLAGWQYTGTGPVTPAPAGYPQTSPLDIHEKVDITALQWPIKQYLLT